MDFVAHEVLEKLLAPLPTFRDKHAVVDDEGIVTHETFPIARHPMAWRIIEVN
jgi:hypothetical protein